MLHSLDLLLIQSIDVQLVFHAKSSFTLSTSKLFITFRTSLRTSQLCEERHCSGVLKNLLLGVSVK